MSTLTPARITSAKTAAKASVKPAVEAPEDPWADLLADAEVAPAFVRGPRVAVVDVPDSVKIMLEQSLTEWNMEFNDPNGRTLEKGTAKFRIVNLKSEKRCKEFLAMAKAWAANRDGGQVSVRAFQVKNGKDLTTTVKFAAMPLVKNETRSMTADNGASSADVRKWAKETGMSVPEKGKLKPEVFAAYNAAHGSEVKGQTTIEA